MSSHNEADVPIESIKIGWTPENPCFECGYCCSNVIVPLSEMPKITDVQYFGELAQYVVNPDTPLPVKDVPLEDGVYNAYTKRGRHVLVIRGRCPENNEVDGSCNIHDKPRPSGCITSKPDEFLKCIMRHRQIEP